MDLLNTKRYKWTLNVEIRSILKKQTHSKIEIYGGSCYCSCYPNSSIAGSISRYLTDFDSWNMMAAGDSAILPIAVNQLYVCIEQVNTEQEVSEVNQ